MTGDEPLDPPPDLDNEQVLARQRFLSHITAMDLDDLYQLLEIQNIALEALDTVSVGVMKDDGERLADEFRWSICAIEQAIRRHGRLMSVTV